MRDKQKLKTLQKRLEKEFWGMKKKSKTGKIKLIANCYDGNLSKSYNIGFIQSEKVGGEDCNAI